LFFQTLDDKSECVGVYVNGRLHFDEIPEGLTKTWKYSGSIPESNIQHAWLYTNGKNLEEVCPDSLKEELLVAQKKFRAYMNAFRIGRISLREHCFFDLVPENFLMEFCEIKNKITEHVFDTYEKPENYEFLDGAHRLIQKIKYQNLNLNKEDCRELYYTSSGRQKANELLKKYSYIDYNLFGTITGRLTTLPNSFPILTVRRDFRKLLKPHNDWFISLDYNAAEARTMLHLNEHEQPEGDVHEWNIKNLFENETERETAKTVFFAWLYNPDSTIFKADCYDRKKVLDKWYKNGYIYTPYGRKILVDERRALNYLIQSVTADRVLKRAIEIDKFLEGKESFISHIVHDEIVIDFSDKERNSIAEIKQIFEKDNFKANTKAAKNYFDFEELKI
tara:strand:- start:2064 stop:3239 length:1176 start_codon:yes stop_codon:yes gene_type:complete